MSKFAKVSIIVPVYGVEKYLEQCLESLLAQTLKDIEIILIDDGSNDNCPQIIDKFAQKDSRIIAIHKENSGYGATVNLGIEKAAGEYVAVVEPDDFCEKNMFENLYNYGVVHNADIVKSDFYIYKDLRHYKKNIKFTFFEKTCSPRGIFTIKEFPSFLSGHPSIWSAIYKREFLKSKNIKFKEVPGAGWVDNSFQVETMCLASRIVYVPEAYYHWRFVDIDDSAALKNYLLPIERGKDIRDFLQEKNIVDNGIMENISKRDLSYIEIILNKNDIWTLPDRIMKCQKFASSLFIPEKPKFLTLKEIKNIKQIITNPFRFYLKIKFKNILKKVLKIKCNSREKYIIIFGKIYGF